MKVFKFGGASVKDAKAVKNVSAILGRFPEEKLLVVVSAMGKTTNKLEELVHALYNQDHRIYAGLLDDIKAYHDEILAGLFPERHYQVYQELEDIFEQINQLFFKPLADNRSFQYDQLVAYGELISSKILAAYLTDQSYKCSWIDAKTIIRTDNQYQEGKWTGQKHKSFAKDLSCQSLIKLTSQLLKDLLALLARVLQLHLEEKDLTTVRESSHFAVMQKA